jgi:DEAD/DEAH box helicase domain-containing protein
MTAALVFDLETKRLADEVGGWSNIEKMGLAAGVTYDVQSDKFARYTEDQADALIEVIHSTDLIIGFNLIRFDFTVLRPYGLRLDQTLLDKSVDLLREIYNTLGFRLGLGNLAEATLGETKSADGIQSVQWYRDGDIDKVLDYCEQDVRVTYELWKFGLEHRYVLYKDRRGNQVRVKANWSSMTAPPST